MSVSGLRTLVAIENAYIQTTFNFIAGDFYITDEGITLVAYSKSVRSPEALAYLVGGLAGGAGIGAGNKQGLREAQANAKDLRDSSYGLTIAERRQRFDTSMFIPRGEINYLECNIRAGKLICRLSTGQKIEFNVPNIKKYQTVVSPYPSSVTYDTKTDPHGIMLAALGFPMPSKVVDTFSAERGNLDAPESTVAGMAANGAYMFRVYSILNTKDDKTQRLVCRQIAGAKPVFARSLADAFQKGIKEFSKNLYGAWNVWAVPVMLVFGGLGFGGLLSQQSSSSDYILPGALAAVAVAIMVLLGFTVRGNLAKIRLNREMISILKST